MSGSSAFHIEPTVSFVESMGVLEKETYGRHGKKGIDEFRDAVGKLLEDLLGWPQVAGLRQEPFPPNTAANVAGWTFHKLTFTCPRVNGPQRQGRLMILVNLADRLIRPVYIYTHAQFPGRVPDGSLKELINAAVRSSPRIPISDIASQEPPPALAATSDSASTGPDKK